jgi:hypothetical protein
LKKTAIFLLALVALAASGCSLNAAVSTAGDAVTAFHEKYNAGLCDEMYDDADQAMKDNVSRDQFIQFCASVHDTYGDVVGAKRTNYSANSLKGTTSRTTVAFTYAVTFEKGSQTEQTNWNIVDDEARLMGWTINLSSGSP